MIVSVSKEIDDSKIRMERARLHISQKELAQRIGTTREKINAIENAKCKKVQIELLEKLANVFELKVEDLLKKEER
jgi:putative transcriptional regulator